MTSIAKVLASARQRGSKRRLGGHDETGVIGAIEGVLSMSELVEQIVAHVQVTGPVSFIKLVKAIPELGGGEHMMCDDSDPNVILWRGLSEEGVAALKEALASGRIHLHPSSLVAYVGDGGYLRLPLAKRRRKNGYTTPHWSPVTLHHRPYKLSAR